MKEFKLLTQKYEDVLKKADVLQKGGEKTQERLSKAEREYDEMKLSKESIAK